MIRDIGDVLDRWSIAKLKAERIGSDESKREFAAFEAELEGNKMKDFGRLLYDINDAIWVLESGLKSGKEKLANPHYILDSANQEALAKIGLTSVLIRNFNHLRVGYKNMVNKLAGEGFQDQKQDHLSEGA